MSGFGHATILIPGLRGLREERLGPQPPFCVLNTKKVNSLKIMSLAAYAGETNKDAPKKGVKKTLGVIVRGTQRGYSLKPLNIALLNVF